MISSDAHKSFLRAAELGCSLGEAWLVANVTTYLWNYSHRAVEQGRLRGLVDVFRPLLASVKQVQLQTCVWCKENIIVSKMYRLVL